MRKAAVKANPLTPPPFGRHRLLQGLGYAESYYTTPMPAPNVSPMQRQSLAQPVLRHRTHISTYRLMQPYYGLRPDYPFFKGSAIVNSAPTNLSVRPKPNVQKRSFFTPGAASQGVMGSPPRFNKALPTPLNNYQPPIY